MVRIHDSLMKSTDAGGMAEPEAIRVFALMDINQLFQAYGIPIPHPAQTSSSTVGSPRFCEFRTTQKQKQPEEDAPLSRVDDSEKRSFAQALLGSHEFQQCKSFKDSIVPKLIGGNITVEIDDEEHLKAVQEPCYSLIGRFVLAKGDPSWAIMDLKNKLSEIWEISPSALLLSPIGKGFYNLQLGTSDLKSKVFSRGSIFLKPGVFRISQ